MSERLLALTGHEVIRALERAGFTVVRITSSYHRLTHRDDPSLATTVPVHAGSTMRGILKQAGLTVEEFRAML